MKVCGIIAEYDPFHLGHAYHLAQARQQSGADYMVCILGCAFSQRGEPMLFSTRDRARMALENGFDLVLGLPVSFSCAQANRFASGGVGILHSLGVVSHLSFGCEDERLDTLFAVARLLNQPDTTYATHLKEGLQQGLSFAAAQGLALQAALPQLPPALLAAPNFILGVAYLRELDRIGSSIIPLPVLRQGSYHGRETQNLPSASRVRAALLQDPGADLSKLCPPTSLAVIKQAACHRPEALDKVLLHHLLHQQEPLMGPEISEGLDQRIKKAARQVSSRQQLVGLVKTRRYPHARINRALSQSLLGLDMAPTLPAYTRLLGFRERALPLLKAIRHSGFPLVSRPAKSSQQGIALDMRAEELWQIGSNQAACAAWQQDIIRIH